MARLTATGPRGADERGAHERVAEADLGLVHPDQPCRGRLGEVGQRQPGVHAHARVEHGLQRSAVLERGDQQQRAGRLRQLGGARREGVLEPVGERQVGGREHAVAEPLDRDRQLDERERVAVGLAQDPVAQGVGELRRAGVEQHPGVGRAEPLERELLQPRRRERGVEPVAQRDDHRDRIGLQTARREREHVGARVVEPVRVLDECEQGRLGGCLREQVERCQRDQEPVRRRRVTQPERGEQRLPLGRGERHDVPEHRAHELVQAGERQVALGLHAGGRAAPAGRARRPRGGRPRAASTSRSPARRGRAARRRDRPPPRAATRSPGARPRAPPGVACSCTDDHRWSAVRHAGAARTRRRRARLEAVLREHAGPAGGRAEALLGVVDVEPDPVARRRARRRGGAASRSSLVQRRAVSSTCGRPSTRRPAPSASVSVRPAHLGAVAVLLRPHVRRLELVDRGARSARRAPRGGVSR